MELFRLTCATMIDHSEDWCTNPQVHVHPPWTSPFVSSITSTTTHERKAKLCSRGSHSWFQQTCQIPSSQEIGWWHNQIDFNELLYCNREYIWHLACWNEFHVAFARILVNQVMPCVLSREKKYSVLNMLHYYDCWNPIHQMLSEEREAMNFAWVHKSIMYPPLEQNLLFFRFLFTILWPKHTFNAFIRHHDLITYHEVRSYMANIFGL